MLIQNSASVHAGIMYGNTKTDEMNFLHFRSERVMNQATVPPIRMPRSPAPVATIRELISGVQKLALLHSLSANSIWK